MRRRALAWACAWAACPAAWAAEPLVFDCSRTDGFAALASPATDYYRLYSVYRGPDLRATMIEILPGRPRPPEEPPYPRDQAVLVLSGGLQAWRESQGAIKTSYGHFKYVRKGQKREQRRILGDLPMHVLTIQGGGGNGPVRLPARSEFELEEYAAREWKAGFAQASRTIDLFSLSGFEAALLLVRAPARFPGLTGKERLWFVLEGSAQVKIGSSVVSAGPKSLLRIPAGEPVSAVPEGRFSAVQVSAH